MSSTGSRMQVRTDVLINFRTLMASGLERTHPEKLQDGSGVDHLSEEFFATADPLIGELVGICGTPPPQ